MTKELDKIKVEFTNKIQEQYEGIDLKLAGSMKIQELKDLSKDKYRVYQVNYFSRVIFGVVDGNKEKNKSMILLDITEQEYKKLSKEEKVDILTTYITHEEEAHAFLSWDEYFTILASATALRSKDPSTKVGCMIVSEENRQQSMGYNGYVQGINEKNMTWNKSPKAPLIDQKYSYIVDSEANAILHAKEDLTGSRIYVTLFPCHNCAKMIASKKIKEVIYISDAHKCRPGYKVSRKIFEEAGIKVRKISLSKKLVKTALSEMEKILLRD